MYPRLTTNRMLIGGHLHHFEKPAWRHDVLQLSRTKLDRTLGVLSLPTKAPAYPQVLCPLVEDGVHLVHGQFPELVAGERQLALVEPHGLVATVSGHGRRYAGHADASHAGHGRDRRCQPGGHGRRAPGRCSGKLVSWSV